MFDAKYKVVFKYKELSYSDIESISNIIKSTDSIKLYKIVSSREIKENKVLHSEEREFKNFTDFLDYLSEDIKCLDELRFIFMDKNGDEIWLLYTGIFNKWELTYNKKTMEVDGFVSNIRNIFKRNIIDIYKQKKLTIFWTVWTLQVTACIILKINGIISYFLSISLIITMLLNVILKRKPYRNHKFIKKNKDEIILNIIFYALGVITPYILEFIKSAINYK